MKWYIIFIKWYIIFILTENKLTKRNVSCTIFYIDEMIVSIKWKNFIFLENC